MGILKNQNKRNIKKDTGFIGTYVSDDVVSFLSLYSLSTGLAKSVIFKDVMAKWVKGVQMQNPKSKLIRDVVERAVKAWKKQGTPIMAFTAKLDVELLNKNIDAKIREEILELFVDEAEKTKAGESD